MTTEEGSAGKETETETDRPQLHDAAMHGEADEVDRLVEQEGVDVNLKYVNFFNGTALHYATARGHEEVARRLINRHKANVDATMTGAREGVTPVHLAALHGYCSILLMLLEAGATSVNAKGDGPALKQATPLLFAARYRGTGEIVQTLINYGADVHATTADSGNGFKNLDRANALHAAAFCFDNDPPRYKEICTVLIKNDADLYSRNKNGKTPEEVGRDSEANGSDQVADFLYEQMQVKL